MKNGVTSLWLLLTALILTASSVVSYSSPQKKKPKAYRDINAIGHRVIGYQSGYGNWYSLDTEKQIGIQLSANYEKSTPLIHDGAMQAYLDRLVQTISQNSDTQFPITTRVVESEDSFAVTLAGGYQYISHALLLQMKNEGELAAVIARGIAHTSLRSATGLATRAGLIKTMAIPVIPDGPTGNSTSDGDLSVPLAFLKFSRDDESAADYFGIQYLYKSGYSPECFISFIQKVWPPQAQPTSKAFSRSPPLPDRLEALRTEIQEILPKQSTAITNTESFATFREHLLTLAPPPTPQPKAPTLLRPDLKRSIDY
ncbi:MAG TPA: M48 family metalloprotease [Terriglobales bacterium]|jgi:predicted Zn-dependent protease